MTTHFGSTVSSQEIFEEYQRRQKSGIWSFGLFSDGDRLCHACIMYARHCQYALKEGTKPLKIKEFFEPIEDTDVYPLYTETTRKVMKLIEGQANVKN